MALYLRSGICYAIETHAKYVGKLLLFETVTEKMV